MGGKVSGEALGKFSLSLKTDVIASPMHPMFSVTLQFGPGEANITRLKQSMNNAWEQMYTCVDEFRRSAEEKMFENMTEALSKISEAKDQLDVIDIEKQMPLTWSAEFGIGQPSLLPTQSDQPPSPAGLYGQLFLTWHWF